MKFIDARFIDFRPSGIGSYTRRLMHIRKFDGIIVKKSIWESELKREFENKFDVIQFSDVHPMSLLSTMVYFKLLLKVPSFRILYPHYAAPIFFWRRTIVVVHDLFPLSVPGYYKNKAWIKIMHFQLMMFLNVQVESIIYASEITRNGITSRYQKLAKKHSEIFLPIYLCTDYRKKKIDQSSEIKLIYIGDCRPHKNIDHILNVVEVLRTEFKISFVFIGPVDKYFEFYRQSLEVINAQVFSSISESVKSKLLKSSDVLISLSSDEGFGIPPHEAANYGLSLLLSDIDVYRHYCSAYNSEFIDLKNIDSIEVLNQFKRLLR